MKITNTELQAAKAWFKDRKKDDYTVYEAMRSTLKEFETRWAEMYHIATHGIFVLCAKEGANSVYFINRGDSYAETLLAFFNPQNDSVQFKIGDWDTTCRSGKYQDALFPCID